MAARGPVLSIWAFLNPVEGVHMIGYAQNFLLSPVLSIRCIIPSSEPKGRVISGYCCKYICYLRTIPELEDQVNPDKPFEVHLKLFYSLLKSVKRGLRYTWSICPTGLKLEGNVEKAEINLQTVTVQRDMTWTELDHLKNLYCNWKMPFFNKSWK